MRPIDADALKIGLEYDGQLSPYLGKMIDACPTVQRWHSVEDELPEQNVEVLGWYKDNPFSAYRRGVVSWNGKGWVFVYARRYVTNVTHWMELPKPPKEERK